MLTKQEKFWSSSFGSDYTDRNSYSMDDWNEFYMSSYGITRIDMNKISLANVNKNISILEVGCNTGMQLRGLQSEGFSNLYGIEIQPYATEKAKEYTKNINIIQGSGFDLPFKNNLFDLVCTNGVLIHISPLDLPKIMDEIYRCSSKYIWGWEYFSEETTTINYRGNKDYLWKANFAKLFLDRFSDLRIVNQQQYAYITAIENGNIDSMYLLEKQP